MSPKFRSFFYLAFVLVVIFGFTVSVAAAPAPSQSAFCSQYYVVQPGDDIYRVASMYGVNWQYLATVNGLSSPYALTIGQSLCIPSGNGTWTNVPVVYPTYNNYNNYPYNTSYPYNNNNYYPYNNNYYYPTVVNPSYYNYMPNNCAQSYTVQWGDTLYNIASRYGMGWTYLASINNLGYPYTLYAGQRICTSINGYNPPNPPTYCRSYHTVQPGQNLFRVGLMYGVSWTYLAWLNNLPNPNAIYAGQSICVMQ